MRIGAAIPAQSTSEPVTVFASTALVRATKNATDASQIHAFTTAPVLALLPGLVKSAICTSGIVIQFARGDALAPVLRIV